MTHGKDQGEELFVKGEKVIVKSHGKVTSTKDYNHVISGFRATIHNAKTSPEAKQHAEEMIAELEASHAQSIAGTATPEHHDQHHKNVVRGLKASLKNHNVKEETKEEIRQRLRDMNEEFDA